MNLTKAGGVLVLALQLAFHSYGAGIQAQNLRCEYRANPLGIGEVQPRLSWQLQAAGRGQEQTAYQVLVASSRELLEKNQGDMWDTGKVVSDQAIQLVYNGKPLVSGSS